MQLLKKGAARGESFLRDDGDNGCGTRGGGVDDDSTSSLLAFERLELGEADDALCETRARSFPRLESVAGWIC